MTPMKTAWLGFLVAATLAGSAAAHKVYFNGVEVEAGLAGQSFAGVEVRFDEQGNVWITAKGYAVKVVDGGKKRVVAPATTSATTPAAPATPAPAGAPMSKLPAAPAAAAVSKHYYVVAIQSRV